MRSAFLRLCCKILTSFMLVLFCSQRHSITLIVPARCRPSTCWSHTTPRCQAKPRQTKPRRAARLHVQPLLPQLGAAASCSWPSLLLAGHPQAARGQREPHVCTRLPPEPLQQGHPEPPCRGPGDWESWRRGGSGAGSVQGS